MDAVSVVDCSEPVTLTLSSSNEQRLKREKNYTLRVTVVTDHGNVSTTTDFSNNTQFTSVIFTLLCYHYRYRVPKEITRLYLSCDCL